MSIADVEHPVLVEDAGFGEGYGMHDYIDRSKRKEHDPAAAAMGAAFWPGLESGFLRPP